MYFPAEAAKLLNDMARTDRPATMQLLNQRAMCSEELANHPHVQVRAQPPHAPEEKQSLSVGFLGVINGILSRCGYGDFVCSVYDDETGDFLRFAIRREDGSVEDVSE